MKLQDDDTRYYMGQAAIEQAREEAEAVEKAWRLREERALRHHLISRVFFWVFIVGFFGMWVAWALP